MKAVAVKGGEDVLLAGKVLTADVSLAEEIFLLFRNEPLLLVSNVGFNEQTGGVCQECTNFR